MSIVTSVCCFSGCRSTPTWETQDALHQWVVEGAANGNSTADARRHLESRDFEAVHEWDGETEYWRRSEVEGFGVERVYSVEIRHDGATVIDTFSKIEFVGL